MSPEAGEMLMGAIAPRLRSAIPRCVQPLNGEDAEELVQDAIVVAAKMLHNVEEKGKKVTPGNVAFYTILHMKSGRRSQTASRSDVMACGAQLDGKSAVLSMEEEVGYDPELDEAIHLGDLLTCRRDDPSMAAAREMDWDGFLASHDYRYGIILKALAEGRSLKDAKQDIGHGAGQSRVYEFRDRLQNELRKFLGDDAIADAVREPGWRGNIVVKNERAACQADRRHR